ncbi:MAG: hypothetical protein FJ279_26075, partial [Planctomycetes bacterium]|nr:hypothetical protein [Planctomycetota bacterium]
MKEALLVGLCLAAGWVSAARAEVRTQTMDDGAIALENECLKAVISPIGARILSLADKARGREEVKVLPYAGGINEVRFGAALNLDDLRSRYALSVRPGQPGSQTVVAVANVVPTDEKPFAATVTKTYTLRDGSSCIHLAVEIANEGQDEIALIPWVRHLLQRGLKEQPEEAHMTDHGAFLRGHPVPGRPHLRRDHDWHFYPAANWTSRVVLPTEDGSNTLATVLKPSDMLKIYNWHRMREDFCTQEVIAAPLFVPPGQGRRWDYCLVLAAPVRNVVYASPALVIGASPHPTGLAAGTKGLELAFAATEEIASLRVKGRLVTLAEPGRALQEHDLALRELSPRDVVRQTIPLALPEHGHCQIRLSFARDGQPFWPGAAVEDRDEVTIPLVVGAQDTSEVVFPGRERRASRLRRVEPQNRMAVRAYGCDAFDAFAFPAGERCFRHDTLTASGTGPVRLHASAGECESFQLILVPRATGEATYEVAAADLTGPSGDRVACEGASEFLYVQTRMPSGYNPRFAVGEYPEALLPTKRVTLTGSERNHPLFVTYRVPREARPGVYRGAVELRDGRGVHRIPVELTVWRITMPARSRWMDTPTSLKMGGTGGVTVKTPDGRAMSREELLRATVDMHLKYRLTPCDSGMTTHLLSGRLGEFEPEMRRYVDAGATKICLGITPKLLQDHAARLPEVARYLAEKGWTGYFYVRPGFDEASTDLIPQIRAACQAWKNVSRIPV